ncbi:MAG: prepilin-type N-terminal cleavage/methylation domain-containing protein [Mycobacteriales bacterium]|nr:prepilin-type N-terminal cleavage/methylation domain-containing protein [Mycobacteriales bacterium]
MLARIRKAKENGEGGFTLIELLVVIIIIGILAAIAIPTFLNQRKKGWDASAKSALKNAATAQESYFTDASTYIDDDDFTDNVGLDAEGFNATSTVTLTTVTATAAAYCMQAFHTSNTTNVWKLDSATGSPVLGTC